MTTTRAETSEGDDGDDDDGDGATRTRARTGLNDSVFTPSYNRDIYMCLHYSENGDECRMAKGKDLRYQETRASHKGRETIHGTIGEWT